MSGSARLADIDLVGRRKLRSGGRDVLELHATLSSALASRGLPDFLARPEIGPAVVRFEGDGDGLVPFEQASPEQRRGGEIALARVADALGDATVAGWLSLALLTQGEAPLLCGPGRAVLTGWGLAQSHVSRGDDLVGALRSGLGRYDSRLVERATPYLAPVAGRAVRWPEAAGAGLLAGAALGLGLFLGWPHRAAPLETEGLRAELVRLQAESVGNVCELPPERRP